MSKIRIKSILKSDDEIYKYEGFGIKQKNKIFFFDDNIKTVIVFGDIITLTRTLDYEINLKFKLNEKLDSYYLTDFGKIDLQTQTKLIKQGKNYLEIHYTLLNENKKIQDFEFILEYSIDT